MTFFLRLVFFAMTLCPSFIFGSTLLETTLPLTFDSGNKAPYGMATTIVSVNGKKMPLVFDLGDSNGVITLLPFAINKMKVHFTGKRVCGKSLDGVSCRKIFIISTLRIGRFLLHDVKATFSSKLWGGASAMQHPGGFKYGLLGMKLLQRYGVLIDYPHSKVILTKGYRLPRGYSSKGWITIPFTVKGGINTAAMINGQEATIIWDTGAVPSIIKENKLYGSRPKACPKYLPYGNHHCRFINTKRFTVSGKQLPNTWFRLTKLPKSLPFDALVGDNFFRHNIVFVNFDRHLLLIRPVSRAVL